jgi:hypothetical protein
MPKKRMTRRMKMVLIAPLGLAAVALFGFIVMSMWNWLVPAVFGGHPITFWQGLGLLILSRILVGGLGGHNDNRHSHGKMDGWERLTPEEREKFRQRLREAGGFTGPAPASEPNA